MIVVLINFKKKRITKIKNKFKINIVDLNVLLPTKCGTM